MKADRAITAIGVLAALTGFIAISVGKVIMGGFILVIAFAIFWSRGGGKFNDRSIYEKIVKTDMSIGGLYEKIKDMDTPLGRAWIAEHKGYDGDSIVFGPGSFSDMVVISRIKDKLDIKHITKTENIIAAPEDAYRLGNVIKASEVEVTPSRYSLFAAFKLASVMLVEKLYGIVSVPDAAASEDAGLFRFYYHNSSEGFFRDSDGNDVLKVVNYVRPFDVRLSDADGAEMASVRPRKLDKKGYAVEKEGFEILANGEHYGELSTLREGRERGFIASTEDGEFRMIIFSACRRANISCNYTIEKDGRLMAVVGGSPRLDFEAAGMCENDVILSYDDDYMVLYALLGIFAMTLNGRFLK